jgi:hypothetical protein
LGRGRGDRLIDAANADWIEVEDFDLRQFDDRGKGEPVGRTMFRRDWLYLTLGESSGLWTTRTRARYGPRLAGRRRDRLAITRLASRRWRARTICFGSMAALC